VSALAQARYVLVRARKVITDIPGWDDEPEAVEVLAEIDDELGEVPEAGKGAYDHGRI
jgi:hypothetical protein